MNRVDVTNTSRYPDAVVREIVRFATDGRETGKVGLNFKGSGKSFGGTAYPYVPYMSTWAGSKKDYLVVARLGPPQRFPIKNHSYRGLKTAPVYDINDWMECAVVLVAHELAHCEQFKMKRRLSEIEAERSAVRTLEKFRAERQNLGLDGMTDQPVG